MGICAIQRELRETCKLIPHRFTFLTFAVHFMPGCMNLRMVYGAKKTGTVCSDKRIPARI